MQTQKMSLANIQGKLSRTEMKNIMAGSDDDKIQQCCIGNECTSCQHGAGPCGPNATLKDC